jgi:hypothetical protein
LHEAAQRYGFDIALVTIEKEMYSALQAERKLLWSSIWNKLRPDLLELARSLASFAASKQLVLFIGAGTSLSCGLPSWYGLLRQLADIAPTPMTPEQQAALFAEPDPLEQGQLLLQHYPSELALKQEIARICHGPTFSLQHALLASLSSGQVITTNYDLFIEQSTRCAGKSIAVIPYQAPRHVDRWLAKMHGCIQRPEDIVITRQDYDLYQERRSALQGVVESLLITSHMLFVGFSLSDPNFLSIIDSVRAATRHYRQEHAFLGTSVQLLPSQELSQHFDQDLRFAWMSDPQAPAALPIAEAARLADIFFDCLNFYCASSLDFIGSQIYESLLSAEDLAVKKALQKMMRDLPPEHRQGSAFVALRECLQGTFGLYSER